MLWYAPATFQRLIERVLWPLIRKGVLIYFEDVLIYAETAKQLIEILNVVLRQLAKDGLKCKATKCLLFTQCVHYLGRVVTEEAIYLDHAKLENITQWQKPEKGNNVASLLGLCNYYRDLISLFAHLSDAFYKASCLDYIDYNLTFEVQFKKLKDQMLQPRIIWLPDSNCNFILNTNASRIAIGAVLKQRFEETNLEHLVKLFSKSLTGSKWNYSVNKLECKLL